MSCSSRANNRLVANRLGNRPLAACRVSVVLVRIRRVLLSKNRCPWPPLAYPLRASDGPPDSPPSPRITRRPSHRPAPRSDDQSSRGRPQFLAEPRHNGPTTASRSRMIAAWGPSAQVVDDPRPRPLFEQNFATCFWDLTVLTLQPPPSSLTRPHSPVSRYRISRGSRLWQPHRDHSAQGQITSTISFRIRVSVGAVPFPHFPSR